MKTELSLLDKRLDGAIYYDKLLRSLYATDASVYRELPLAVALPKTIADIKELIAFAQKHNQTLIPRTAGTSLAGQCVGAGIIVDVSKHFTKILELNVEAKTVKVQPGVIRDDLNRSLLKHGLFFGPNTSTSNRCMIGGMAGNNSSGSTSIKYGVTRDKVLEMAVLLSDGSEVTFGELTAEAFLQKLKLETHEGDIYRHVYETFSKEKNNILVAENFPKPEIHRRNTGYALDALIDCDLFSESSQSFNMCKLLCGSEGTLAFTTSITLQLDELPPLHHCVVALHFESVEHCLEAVKPAMAHDLYSCEMMDKTILDCTKKNLKYEQLRDFVVTDPKAMLLCELRSNALEDLAKQKSLFVEHIQSLNLSYAEVILDAEDADKAFELRKAGLGLLGNMVGDKKAVACIEDTAVALDDLTTYIKEFSELMTTFNQEVVYYAHAGAGELHLRPILNLKSASDVVDFKAITYDVAKLVKRYQGSMSGEHGDGRLRAEFIEFMVGTPCYNLLREIKQIFDPHNIFNAGKIIDAPPMNSSLRYQPARKEPKVDTLLDFSDTQGILRLAEKCNGSGDCRKSVASGGTMCPSYRATKDEKDTTRARANALREFLTNSTMENKFGHHELKDVFDLCISCKGCKSECPSNVDVSALKAEFEYQYQKLNGSSLRSKVFVNNTRLNAIASKVPSFTNYIYRKQWSSSLLKSLLGVAKQRSLPTISKTTFRDWYSKSKLKPHRNPRKTVYLFVDEFTNYLESEIGQDAFFLLQNLGYEVLLPNHKESGRSFISKGFLKQAKEIANRNVFYLVDEISAETPLIGIEPSAILTFRDEYLRLVDDKDSAQALAKHCFTIEEFIANEIKLGNITESQFSQEEKTIKLHVHCHQKALSNQKHSFDMLNLPTNYKVTIIPSGCCGMAGSFGYEKEHYDISMAIGEHTLFPAVRKASEETIIAAAGTSCRHQIKDGTQRESLHPVTILRKALN